MHTITHTTLLTSCISTLQKQLSELPHAQSDVIKKALGELKVFLAQKESAYNHFCLQERISSIKELLFALPSAEKLLPVIHNLFTSESRAELLFYAKNSDAVVPEQARERIRLAVQQFDQQEEIDRSILALHLTRSSDPFLRKLLSLCLEREVSPPLYHTQRHLFNPIPDP